MPDLTNARVWIGANSCIHVRVHPVQTFQEEWKSGIIFKIKDQKD